MKLFRKQSIANMADSSPREKRKFFLNKAPSLKSLLGITSTGPLEDSFSTLNESWCNASLNKSATWNFQVNALSPKRVAFDDATTEYYDSPWLINNCNGSIDGTGYRNHRRENTFVSTPTSECKGNANKLGTLVEVMFEDVWYTRSNVLKFRSDAQGYARVLMKERALKDASYDPVAVALWSQSMWMAYEDLHEASSKDQMKSIMSCRPTTPTVCVGLEKWALPGVQIVRTRQRQALYRALEWAQSTKKSPRELRRISRPISRGSRSFAVYVGRSIADNSSNV